jgi:Lactoylglutathione lyase and related lyases
MRRLVQIILFTPDVDSMRNFYEEGMGLRPVYAGPNWTSYRTAGAILALHPLDGGHRQEIELTFDSPDVEAEVEHFRNWGVHATSEVQGQTYGTTVQFRDPAGNLIALRTGGDRPGDSGPVVGSAVLNVEDLDAAVAFYREHVGLAPTYVSPHWVEFDAGDVRLALHKRGAGLHHPLHGGRPSPSRSRRSISSPGWRSCASATCAWRRGRPSRTSGSLPRCWTRMATSSCCARSRRRARSRTSWPSRTTRTRRRTRWRSASR